MVVVPGEIVELGCGEEVVLEEGVWEVRVGSAFDAGYEGLEAC